MLILWVLLKVCSIYSYVYSLISININVHMLYNIGTKVAILHLAKRGGGVIINTASTGAFNADL